MKLEELQKIKDDVISKAKETTTFDDIEKIRISYLSKKGMIPQIMSQIKHVPKNEKAKFGQ